MIFIDSLDCGLYLCFNIYLQRLLPQGWWRSGGKGEPCERAESHQPDWERKHHKDLWPGLCGWSAAFQGTLHTSVFIVSFTMLWETLTMLISLEKLWRLSYVTIMYVLDAVIQCNWANILTLGFTNWDLWCLNRAIALDALLLESWLVWCES